MPKTIKRILIGIVLAISAILGFKSYKFPDLNVKSYIPKFSNRQHIDYTPAKEKTNKAPLFDDFVRDSNRFPEDYGEIIFNHE